MNSDKLIKYFSVLAPYLGAAGSGAAIGGALTENKGSGSLKGAMIGLGSLLGGKAGLSIGSMASKKILGKNKVNSSLKIIEDMQNAKKLYPKANLINIRVIASNIHAKLIKSGLTEDAAKFAKEVENPANFANAYHNLSDKAQRSVKDISFDFRNIAAKHHGISELGSGAGFALGTSGAAYALKNDSNKKK